MGESIAEVLARFRREFQRKIQTRVIVVRISDRFEADVTCSRVNKMCFGNPRTCKDPTIEIEAVEKYEPSPRESVRETAC